RLNIARRIQNCILFLQKNVQSSNNTIESTNELVESEQHILNFLDSMDTYLTPIGWLDLASSRQSMGALRVSSVLFDLKSHHASTTLQLSLPRPLLKDFSFATYEEAIQILKLHELHAFINELTSIIPGDRNMESPHFTLSKWASSDDPEKHSEEAKFEEDELLQNKSNESPREHNHDTPQSPSMPLFFHIISKFLLLKCFRPAMVQDFYQGCSSEVDQIFGKRTWQAQRERSKSLSMFGTLVSPKLRATQLSFETGIIRMLFVLIFHALNSTVQFMLWAFLAALEMLIEIANMRASLLCAYKQVLHDQKTEK
ncbi:hypothetical protein STAS_26965, partial [Striga asiatica]